MEKEALIQSLKEKSQIDNLSERTIDEVATMFLPQFADDEKITDESWGLPVQMLKTMSGQLRHDLSGGINAFKTQFETENKDAQAKAIADAIAAAKAEWEKNNKPGGAEPPKTEDLEAKIAEAVAKATGEQTKAFEELSKKFGEYMAQVAEEKKTQTIANTREQLKNYLISLGVEEDDYALEIALEKLEIGEKPDFDALKTKVKSDYEAIYKRMHKGEGGLPFNGGGGNGGGSNQEFENYIKEKQALAAQEAKDAEALKKDMM